MEQAADVEAFRRSPEGRYVAGRAWLHFCAGSGLFGVVLFGRPDRHDVASLVRSLAVELGEGVPVHASLVDASRLEGADAGAFEELAAYVRARHDDLGRQVRRLAIVRPRGIEGAIVAGFFGVLAAPYPVQVLEEPRAALAWLGEPERLGAELDALVAGALGTDPTVRALRAFLAEHLLDAAPREASLALGVSERTLQRRLAEAGTSFRREQLHVRLRGAERRMLSSADPLTTVALDCGFASLSHFSSQFRAATGQSPTAWRAARRAEPPLDDQ